MIIAAVPRVTKSGYSSSISYTQCYQIWLQQQYQLHFYSGSTWLYLIKVINTLTGTWVKSLAVVARPLHLHNLHLCLVTAAVAGYSETEYLLTAEYLVTRQYLASVAAAT